MEPESDRESILNTRKCWWYRIKTPEFVVDRSGQISPLSRLDCRFSRRLFMELPNMAPDGAAAIPEQPHHLYLTPFT